MKYYIIIIQMQLFRASSSLRCVCFMTGVESRQSIGGAEISQLSQCLMGVVSLINNTYPLVLLALTVGVGGRQIEAGV